MNPTNTNASAPRAPRARFLARTVVPLTLLLGAAAVLVSTGLDALRTTPEVPVTPVAVLAGGETASDASQDSMQAAGWIEPAPFAHEVRARRSGIVASVLALEGTAVEAGAVLARLESESEEAMLRAAEASLAVARATAAKAEQALAAAEKLRALALEPGRRLALAEAALSEANAELARLDAEIREAEALHAEARDEAERKSKLVASGSVSEGEARRLVLRAQALEAKLGAVALDRAARNARRDAAKAELDAARIARETLLAESSAVDAARAALSEAQALVARSEADVAIAALALARSEIRAPVAGTVLSRHAAPGGRADSESMPLFELYDPRKLQVRCDLPLRDAARLAVGLDAEIRVDALPDRVFKGRLARIVPLGDIQKNTVQCKVDLFEPDAALRPEMLARVRIFASSSAPVARGEVVAAPVSALRARTDDTAEVVVAIPDGRVSRTEVRRVELGRERGGGWIEIRAGLAAGDRVVLEPAIGAGVVIAAVERPIADAPAAEGNTP
jgi:RND family efflux transporter MFP subunit